MVAQIPDGAQVRPPDDPVDVAADAAALVSALAAQAPALPTVDAADDEEATPETVVLVRTGLIRMTIGGKRYRLRRPFFGEFKRIRLALEDLNDEVADARIDTQTIQRKTVAEGKALDDEGTLEDDPDARAEWERTARKRARDASRTLLDTADRLREEFWTDVFATLSQDGTPEQWPGWIGDPDLPGLVIEHWRATPLGRG